MDLPEQVFRVGAEDTRDTLLARIEAATTPKVVLRVTREASVPRSIEDFQALKSLSRRRNLRLRIVSPVASVVGLAKIYDIEAQFDATVGKTDALNQAAPAPAAPSSALTPLPPPAPAPPLTPLPSAASPPAAPPASDLPQSDNDWLFGGLDAETIESDFASERGRSAAPPPEFGSSAPGWPAPPLPAAPPPAPSVPLPPPADIAAPPLPPTDLPPAAPPLPQFDNDWLFGGLDVDTIESDFATDRRRSAAPPPEPLTDGPSASAAPSLPVPTAPPPPESVPVPDLLPIPPSTPSAAPPAAPAARDPLQNSLFLPDWLRTIPTGTDPIPPQEETLLPAPTPRPPPPVPAPTPAAAISAPALFAHGPATKPGPRWTVPCPHCGEPMDLELLIQKADYQD